MDMQKLGVRLVSAEGLRYQVYDDATGKPLVKGSRCYGNPTIGIGRELAKHGLSEAEIQYLVANDINACVSFLSSKMPQSWSGLSDARQRALVEMVFNLGSAGFAQFVGFIADIEAGNFGKAADDLKLTKVYGELPNRYSIIVSMIRSGVD